LAFIARDVPLWLVGAPGFWVASTGGFTLAAIALLVLLHRFTSRRAKPAVSKYMT